MTRSILKHSEAILIQNFITVLTPLCKMNVRFWIDFRDRARKEGLPVGKGSKKKKNWQNFHIWWSHRPSSSTGPLPKMESAVRGRIVEPLWSLYFPHTTFSHIDLDDAFPLFIGDQRFMTEKLNANNRLKRVEGLNAYFFLDLYQKVMCLLFPSDLED